jgi:hypothetical protein
VSIDREIHIVVDMYDAPVRAFFDAKAALEYAYADAEERLRIVTVPLSAEEPQDDR